MNYVILDDKKIEISEETTKKLRVLLEPTYKVGDILVNGDDKVIIVKIPKTLRVGLVNIGNSFYVEIGAFWDDITIKVKNPKSITKSELDNISTLSWVKE